MRKTILSVIIPVYKAEKYLHTCIESILSQTFENFEILLIDDESPDKSGVICDTYASKDKRIHVIHKKNGGVSAARNTGIELAKGEWITFIDSDDWIENNCFLISMNKIKKYNLDLLQFSYRRVNNTQKILYQSIEETCLQEPNEYISTNKFLITVCGGVFKKSLIQENNIKFDTSLKLGEDQLFIYKYILSCNRCMRISNLLYNYRYNNESASVISNANDCIISFIKFQNFEFRKIYELKIQEALYSFFIQIAKRNNIISTIKTYNLIKQEPFNLVKPGRKLDSLILFFYKYSKYLSILIIRLLHNKL